MYRDSGEQELCRLEFKIEAVDTLYSFYYVDERTADGAPVYNDIDGDAHAEVFFELAQKSKQEEPIVTFVKGKGIVSFRC